MECLLCLWEDEAHFLQLLNKGRFMKVIGLLVLLMAAAGCQQNVAYKPISNSAYIQVENTPFDRFIVRDKEVFSQYDKVIFSALRFDQFEVVRSRDKRVYDSWELSVDDKVEYASYFKDELLKVFGGDKAATQFGLGTGRDERTLYAEVRLLQLNPLVAQHGENTSGTISRVTVESFGVLTVQMVLIDSVTEEFVAVIEDARDLATSSQVKSVVNKASATYAWKKTFNSWLQDLKATLTALKNENNKNA